MTSKVLLPTTRPAPAMYGPAFVAWISTSSLWDRPVAEALERSHVQCVDHVGTGWVGMIALAGIRGQSAAAAGLRPPDRQPNKCRRAGVNEPKWAFSGAVGATGRDNMGGGHGRRRGGDHCRLSRSGIAAAVGGLAIAMRGCPVPVL